MLFHCTKVVSRASLNAAASLCLSENCRLIIVTTCMFTTVIHLAFALRNIGIYTTSFFGDAYNFQV